MDQQQRATVAFPPPLEEYKQFTKDGENPIQPPEIPDTPFSVFNKPQNDDDVPSLESQGIPVLYDPSEPPLLELKKINHQILFTIQDLFQTLAGGNENPDKTLDQMKYLFMNAHYLLHKLRTVQAYEHMHHCLREKKRQLDLFQKRFDDQLAMVVQLKPP
ncbi:MED7 protein [Trichomonas vaginalis G3]|uniref:Mediator of RNA polymerase II transcription subunit 7 n=1 Tax=Trichomonas vaginalis (strain ATCC PRA-98 / G3) TaxID=412133 RepID=A2DFB6_TRIV3|nr:regulation of transcription by RNA polymerase II [Trichomonas vaginalis G3]EAY20844.1 MED7 protein [Trichomonas vaginalis G3]KAI5521545.1 regulation of transcription by RNA polymerase II [Trichomonas vaginalis G3]|eukprot:XP_001581830.1 MED7 protein [Trichomonas vaginalis G3]